MPYPHIQSPWEKIVNRSNAYISDGSIFSNYGKAIDTTKWATMMQSWIAHAGKFNAGLGKIIGIEIPAGGSNCTLTASQWIDPTNPIMRASTITSDPMKHGYRQVEEGLPGDLVIADNGKGSYHSMLLNRFSDFDNAHYTYNGRMYTVRKGDPLVNYSNGLDSAKGLRQDIPLKTYLDLSNGKYNVRYYRSVPKGVIDADMPPLEVTPSGNSMKGDIKYYWRP